MSPFHSFALLRALVLSGRPVSVPEVRPAPHAHALRASAWFLSCCSKYPPCHFTLSCLRTSGAVSQAVISDIAHVCKNLWHVALFYGDGGISSPPIPEGMHITGTGRGGALGRAAESTEKSPQGVPFCVSLTLKNTPRGYVIIFFAFFAIFHPSGSAPRLAFGA